MVARLDSLYRELEEMDRRILQEIERCRIKPPGGNGLYVIRESPWLYSMKARRAEMFERILTEEGGLE